MHASVPEFTNLTLSILGADEITNSAISVSIDVGIPNEVPFLAIFEIELTTGSYA